MTKEQMNEAHEQFWFQTKPVARSLYILDRAGKLEYVEGNTRGTSLFPFTVKLTEPLNNGLCFVSKATDLHRIAQEVGLSAG